MSNELKEIDLTQNQRKTVNELLKQYLPHTEVWAYGSRVKFTSKPQSDLDMVAFATHENKASISKLKEAFEESSLPFRVDLFVWDEVPAQFHKNIKRDKVILQKKSSLQDWDMSSKFQPLNEFITLQKGHDLPSKDRLIGNIPVVASTGIVGYHNTAKAKAPGVVIGRSGSIGGGQYITNDYWPLNTTLWVKDFKGHNERFVYYLLKNIDFSGFNVGTGVPTLNRNHLSSIRVPYKGRITEDNIVAILGSLDDKIALNRAANQTLEEIAQALFKSWFVDFDPVKAKTEGRKPVGMDGATAALFPDSFVESELGLIPQGWSVDEITEIIDVNPKRVLKAKALAPFLDIKNMPTKGHTVGEVTNKEFTSGTKFKNNDTLLALITPCPENGKTAFVDFLKDNEIGWGSSEYIVLAARNNTPPQFIYLLSLSEKFRTHAIQHMTGSSGRHRVAIDGLKSYIVAVPNTEEVFIIFENISTSIFKMIKENSDESKSLTVLRDTLLPKLLSGQISVSEIEEDVMA